MEVRSQEKPFRSWPQLRTTRHFPFRVEGEVRTTRHFPFQGRAVVRTTHGFPFQSRVVVRTTPGFPFQGRALARTARHFPFRHATATPVAAQLRPGWRQLTGLPPVNARTWAALQQVCAAEGCGDRWAPHGIPPSPRNPRPHVSAVEPAMGIEPITTGLQGRCSTIEPRWRVDAYGSANPPRHQLIGTRAPGTIRVQDRGISAPHLPGAPVLRHALVQDRGISAPSSP